MNDEYQVPDFMVLMHWHGGVLSVHLWQHVSAILAGDTCDA
jgi:hypothetical protein